MGKPTFKSRSKIYKINQCIVFILTFISYASFHACRQSFADAKKSLQEKWGYTKHEEGAMDGIFLFSYALGLYASGLIGDLFDTKKVHAFGLFFTGLILTIFASMIPYFKIDNHALFLIIWSINGFVQSLGWPTAVKLVANWFDGKHDGALFGIWASNQCIGNIIGALYVNMAHNYNWNIQWMFYLPSIQAVIVSILILIFIKTTPQKLFQNNNAKNLKEQTKLVKFRKKSKKEKRIDQLLALSDEEHKEEKNNKVKNISSDSSGESVEMIKINNIPFSLIKNEDDTTSITPTISMDTINTADKTRLSFIEILKLEHVITYSLCYACLKATNYAMFFWLPYFESDHFDDAQSDNLEISYNVGQIFGGLLCGYISDRFSKRTPTVVSFLIVATIPMFLLHISSLSFFVVLTLTFFAGFFVGGPSNILSTVMGAEIAKNPQLKHNHSTLATVTGIIDGTGSVGAALTQYIIAYLSDVSMELVFGYLSALLIVSALLISPLCFKECRQMRIGLNDIQNIKDNQIFSDTTDEMTSD